MTRRVRTGAVLLASAALLLANSDSVWAAIWIRFEPRSAPPGALVRGKTAGPSMEFIPSGRLSLFLAPASEADSVKSPDDPRLVPIGDLVADAADVGRITFKVPNIPPGRYMTVAYCEECASGGTVFTVGPLKVIAGSAATGGTSGEDPTGSALPIGAILAAVALGLATIAFVVRVQRSSRHRSGRRS